MNVFYIILNRASGIRKTNSFLFFLWKKIGKLFLWMLIQSTLESSLVFFYFQNVIISHKIYGKYTIKGLENIDIKDIYNNPDKIEHIHEIKVAFSNMMTNQEKGD